jgi:coenzyme Q-binding protein COQ10
MRGEFTKVFPHYAPADLFALVDDIESYPTFAPFCRRARVLSGEGALRRVENVFGAGPWQVRFVSEARADPPRELVIESSDGPLRAFRLRWLFESQREGCRLTCQWMLEFASPLLNAGATLAGKDFERRVLDAFERRAAATIGTRASA